MGKYATKFSALIKMITEAEEKREEEVLDKAEEVNTETQEVIDPVEEKPKTKTKRKAPAKKKTTSSTTKKTTTTRRKRRTTKAKTTA